MQALLPAEFSRQISGKKLNSALTLTLMRLSESSAGMVFVGTGKVSSSSATIRFVLFLM